MMKIARWISFVLVLAMLLALPAAAQTTQEKSWDVDGNKIYNLLTNYEDNVFFVILDDSGEASFGQVFVACNDSLAYDMEGQWTMAFLDGDAMDISLNYSSDTPSTGFVISGAQPGQTARFSLTYTSDQLRKPLQSIITVTTLKADETIATGMEYAKTEHTVKTGTVYSVDSPTLLPQGSSPLLPIPYFAISDYQGPYELLYGEQGYVDFDASDGSFSIMACQPGDYSIEITFIVSSSAAAKVVHTFHVTGEPTEWELPEFRMDQSNVVVNRLLNDEEEIWPCHFYIADSWAWEEDEILLSIEQLSGAETQADLEYDPNWPFDGDVVIQGPLDLGSYVYRINAQNLTRDEDAHFNLTINVEEPSPSLVEPESITYKKLKPTMTLKAGKTLSLGAPVVSPKNFTLSDDAVYYIWVEEDLGDVYDRMIKSDEVTGKHQIVGVLPGTYKVHVGLSMFGETMGVESVFTLTVEEPKNETTSLSLKQQGTWDNPYELTVGKTLKLTPQITPKKASKDLIWESDDPDAISVSSKGVVKAILPNATAEIRAYTTDGSELCASIVVKSVEPIPTKITLKKKKLTMKVGETTTLKVTFKPAGLSDSMKSLVWLSEDTTVVQVDRTTGEITAVAPGKAKVYAYACDKDWRPSDDVFASCTVTVKD